MSSSLDRLRMRHVPLGVEEEEEVSEEGDALQGARPGIKGAVPTRFALAQAGEERLRAVSPRPFFISHTLGLRVGGICLALFLILLVRKMFSRRLSSEATNTKTETRAGVKEKSV